MCAAILKQLTAVGEVALEPNLANYPGIRLNGGYFSFDKGWGFVTYPNMKKEIKCPHCGEIAYTLRNPLVTVDIIIELDDRGIVLIKRKNPPYGWAIPGGFVDYGESLEQAAVREAREETSLNVKLIKQFHTYSQPERDPRHHTISTVYIAKSSGTPKAQDDATTIGIFKEEELPEVLAFDHKEILREYFRWKRLTKG